jgi:hypothetical protein
MEENNIGACAGIAYYIKPIPADTRGKEHSEYVYEKE